MQSRTLLSMAIYSETLSALFTDLERVVEIPELKE